MPAGLAFLAASMITMIMVSRAITMMTSADHQQQHKSMLAAADTSI